MDPDSEGDYATTSIAFASDCSWCSGCSGAEADAEVISLGELILYNSVNSPMSFFRVEI